MSGCVDDVSRSPVDDFGDADESGGVDESSVDESSVDESRVVNGGVRLDESGGADVLWQSEQQLSR